MQYWIRLNLKIPHFLDIQSVHLFSGIYLSILIRWKIFSPKKQWIDLYKMEVHWLPNTAGTLAKKNLKIYWKKLFQMIS